MGNEFFLKDKANAIQFSDTPQWIRIMGITSSKLSLSKPRCDINTQMHIQWIGANLY